MNIFNGKSTDTRRRRKRPLVLFLLLSLTAISSCSLTDPDDPDDPDDDLIVGTGVYFRGTVSDDKQLASNSIDIRAQSGEYSTSDIAQDGQYEAASVSGTGPWLLRSSLGNNSFRYGIAFASVTTQSPSIAHIHSYTDLILRGWFLAEHNTLNIDDAFSNAGALPSLPSSTQYSSLADQYFRIVELVLQDYGLVGSQLLQDEFRTNNAGIDRYLDLNPVLVTGNEITIVNTLPDGNTQTSLRADLLLGGTLDPVGITDTIAPSIPSNLRALTDDRGDVVLVWDPSTDNAAVAGYDIIRNGEVIAISSFPVYTDTSVPANTSLTYEIRAVDTAGNRSVGNTVTGNGTPREDDITPPSLPLNLMSTVASTRLVELIWTHDTISDVAGFNVFRGTTPDNMQLLISVSNTQVSDLTVTAGQEYCYGVSALDVVGNESSRSDIVCVRTTGITVEPEATPIVGVSALAGLNVPDIETIDCIELFPGYNVFSNVTLSNTCYRVEEDILVDNFGVLSLQPGTILKFAAGTQLLVGRNGRLVSEGTDMNPVVLSGERAVPGWWRGVELNKSDDPRNIISRTVIEYTGGGSTDAALLLTSSTNAPSRLKVNNSLIRFSDTYAIGIPGLDSKLDSFSGNLITENQRAAFVNHTALTSVVDGSEFSDNTLNRVFVPGTGYVNDIVINDPGIPIQIDGIDQIRKTIIINEGVELRFVDGAGFSVRDNLAIRGTAANPVTLTSANMNPGDWLGLQLIDGANVEISHAIIEYAGQSGIDNPDGANLFANDARLALENVTLRFSSSYGYHAIGNNVRIDKAELVSSVDNARPDVVNITSQ